MTSAELEAGVQYTVDEDGHLVAVVVSAALWRRLLEELEDVEDRELIKTLTGRLAGGPFSIAGT